MIGALYRRILQSSTLMTMANLVAKSAMVLLLAPLGVRLLPSSLGVTWTLSINLVSLSVLMDLGISTIISRHVTAAGVSNGSDPGRRARVLTVARGVYRNVALFYAVLVGAIAMYLWTAASHSSRPGLGESLVVTLFAGPAYLYQNYRYAFLMGRNEVAMVNRVQALSTLSALLPALGFLLVGSHVLALLALYSGLLAPAAIFGRILKAQGFEASVPTSESERRTIYGDIYRAAFGAAMSLVIYNAASYFYSEAFRGKPGLLSALLLLQILRGISSFAQAPFYSKLPTVNSLYAQGRWSDCLKYGLQRMGLGLGLQALGFITFYLLVVSDSTRLIPIVPSPINEIFYLLLAAALLAERLAAMLLQIYTATGHVIWHTVNGVSGTLQIILLVSFSASIGLDVFPIALLASVVCFQLPVVLLSLRRVTAMKASAVPLYE